MTQDRDPRNIYIGSHQGDFLSDLRLQAPQHDSHLDLNLCTTFGHPTRQAANRHDDARFKGQRT
jgi:hypothetical protein